MKLTTTSTWPREGWQYFDPKTGYREPTPMAHSFTEVVRGILSMRMNNRHIYPQPADRTYESAQRALENYTTARLARIGDWGLIALEPGDEQKLSDSGIKVKKKPLDRQSQQSLQSVARQAKAVAVAKPAANVVERGGILHQAKQLAGGVALLRDWTGTGAPVSPELANKRAKVCVECPLNNRDPNWLDKLTTETSEAVRSQMELKTTLKLATDLDEQLGVCDACLCPMKLKVWVPLDYILKHTSEDTYRALHPKCWIREESGGVQGQPVNTPKPTAKPITVQRRGAIGDVVMATGVMKRLSEVASVSFYTCPGMEVLTRGMSFLRKVESGPWKHTDANLDLSYEKLSDKERATNPIPELFMRTALRALEARGIKLKHPLANLTPELHVTTEEYGREWEQLDKLGAFRLPIVAVVPRSNYWPCRTVSHQSWELFERAIRGKVTLIWTGTDPPPSGYLDMRKRDLRKLTAMLKACDLVVGVDTGPMHLAAGTGTRLVHITQSVAGKMTLPEQRDWIAFSPPLDCIACHAWKCPINEALPPCQTIDGEALARLVIRRLERRGVSAVIATYRPEAARINRAIEMLLPQVTEIVVALDGDTPREGIMQNERIQFVQHYSRKRRGFGKTFNFGARHAHGKWLLSVNDDVFLAPNAVQLMKTTLEQDLKSAVVGCLLRYPDGSIQHGGTFRGPTGYGHMDVRQQKASLNTSCEMECVTFAASMFRREAFFAVNGFDERYDCYWEDPDFCLRSRRAGWKVFYEPRATGVHIESATTNSLNKDQMLREGGVTFHGSWQWYFDRNKQTSRLGVFA